ncbi:MAG: hypothetical protein CVV44_01695 [Spirochaetae bacterium HGW-Spirochaetae-1]|jgi:putative ABC transport system permease protein|nr:MAG: hypothetical protein CVV44_01695 [Spirochaetae bacterium HGW-Spirochaetae-1]
MKYLVKLSIRNILRAKRRTLLTFTMLTFGVIIYIIVEGMLEGFDQASFKNFIDFETGHFKIRSGTFDEDHPYDTDNYIHDTGSVERKLAALSFVGGYTSRIHFIAEADNSVDSSPVLVTGIDPVRDRDVFSLENFIVTGSLERKGILIGKSLAQDLHTTMGDGLFITFRNSRGMYTSAELTITGLIQTADPRINNSTVFINIGEARELMTVPGAAEISFRVDDFHKTDQYKPILETAFPGMNIRSWRELSTNFTALMEMKKKSSAYILFFIVTIALVGIINTILMSVYEKRREIGTLMALGMDQREVRNIFLFEGFLIGTLGSISGIIIGTLINLYFIYVGIDYTAMLGDKGMGFNVMGYVKSAWVFSAYAKALIISILASVIASYYPAKKVMKMVPMECLRTVQ